MKLILAIIQDKDANNLSSAFVDANVRATKLSTTGGFLKAGNTTFIVGIEDERVQEVLDIIKANGQTREQFMAPPIMNVDAAEVGQSYPIQVEVGGATVFVMPVESFHQF